MNRRFTLVGLLLFAVFTASAETIRGPIVDIVSVTTEDMEGLSRTVRLDEILAVRLDADPRFLQGIEIVIQVPAAVRQQPGSVAVSGLVSLTPDPERRVMGLRGARVLHQPLLRSQRMFLLIPVFAGASFRSSADTSVLDQVIPPESFPLALTFTDIAKGSAVPRDTTMFDVRIRPVVNDLGAVALRMENESGEEIFPGDDDLEDVTIRIDGRSIDPSGEEILLPAGLYTMELTSPTYLESSQTFGVERGRVQEVSVPLVRPKATVRLDAPRGAEVFVNGAKVGASTVELSEGEHVALVRIGDYSVSRRFSVERKKSYIISVSLDIIVNEVE